MRVMLRATLDTPTANDALKSGTVPEVVKSIMDRLKPEAAYFGPVGGYRCMMMVFDMTDSSQLPPIGEPLFEKLGARVEIFPVMNAEELQKGLAAMK
jgi:hypothetical protein